MFFDALQSSRRTAPSLTALKTSGKTVAAMVTGAALLLFAALFLLNQYGHEVIPSLIALLAFIAGVIFICVLAKLWLRRIEAQPLLRADEKLQNKDSLVIATASLLAMHLGLCVTAASAFTLFSERGCPAAFCPCARP